jgi:hypothetical protein
LDLAEPKLIQAGDTIWLMLRIADQLSLLRLDARLVSGGAPRLSRPFEQLTVADEPFNVGRGDLFFADTDGMLALLRPPTGQCWRVGPGGRLIRQPAREPRPAPTVPPLVVPGPPGGPPRVLEFIADVAVGADPMEAAATTARFPQLILTTPKGRTVIDRDAMNIRLGFPIRALRLTAWCVDGADLFAYDAMSGEVFRIELKDIDPS